MQMVAHTWLTIQDHSILYRIPRTLYSIRPIAIMSSTANFKIIKTGEKNNCFFVKVNALTAPALQEMLGGVQVVRVNRTGNHYLKVNLESMTSSEATRWFQLYKNAKMEVPPEIMAKIEGEPPARPRSTIYYANTPVCDKRYKAENFATAYDNAHNLRANEAMGALSGAQDHAQMSEMARNVGISIGGDGDELEEDWEGKYEDLHKRYVEMKAMVHKCQEMLVEATGDEWIATVHEGADMLRFIASPARRGVDEVSSEDIPAMAGGARPTNTITSPTFDRHRAARERRRGAQRADDLNDVRDNVFGHDNPRGGAAADEAAAEEARARDNNHGGGGDAANDRPARNNGLRDRVAAAFAAAEARRRGAQARDNNRVGGGAAAGAAAAGPPRRGGGFHVGPEVDDSGEESEGASEDYSVEDE